MVPFWGKSKKRWTYAVHRLICNQQVGGSNPPAGSIPMRNLANLILANIERSEVTRDSKFIQ